MPFRSKNFETNPSDPELLQKEKKRKYFYQFAVKHKPELFFHREYGLWPDGRPYAKDSTLLAKKKKDIKGWANVSEHCLVEAVAADVLAEALEFSKQDRDNIVEAAMLHDFFVRTEKQTVRQAPPGQEEAINAEMEQRSHKILEQEYKATPEVLKLTSAVGVSSFGRMEEPDVTMPEMVMHYIDDITNNTEIVPIEQRVEGVKRRMPNLINTTIFETQLRIGKHIEAILAAKLKLDDPEKLTELINNKIAERTNVVEIKL